MKYIPKSTVISDCYFVSMFFEVLTSTFLCEKQSAKQIETRAPDLMSTFASFDLYPRKITTIDDRIFEFTKLRWLIYKQSE